MTIPRPGAEPDEQKALSRSRSGGRGLVRRSITERYVHAAQTAFPGAAERTEERIFGPVAPG